MSDTVAKIRQIVASITPFDELEMQHQRKALEWIDSGSPIFRSTKSDVPPKHLVAYFILFDADTNLLMLCDHIKSGLWLPAGGHVELDEHPVATVRREAIEELNMSVVFDQSVGTQPMFVSAAETVGQSCHTDVSLWFVLQGQSTSPLNFDRREMSGYRWLSPAEIISTPILTLDPNMHRFVNKLCAVVG